jgi:hypothetical protein
MSKSKSLGLFLLILICTYNLTGPKKPHKYFDLPPKKTVEPEIIRYPFPKPKLNSFPTDFYPVHNKLSGIYKELTTSFPLKNVPVIALPVFKSTEPNISAGLVNYLTESAYSHLYYSKNMKIVKREYNISKKSRIKTKYILIGRISPVINQYRITLRLEDINTGEIIESFDDYIDKSIADRFL